MKYALLTFGLALMAAFMWVAWPGKSPCRVANYSVVKLFNCAAPMQHITWSF